MQRSTRQTRGANADEKRFMGWLKNLNFCWACSESRPVICHHIYGSSYKHNKVLIGHWAVLGLCQECDDIVTHQSRRKFEEEKGKQEELWLEAVQCYGIMPPPEVYASICDHGKVYEPARLNRYVELYETV